MKPGDTEAGGSRVSLFPQYERMTKSANVLGIIGKSGLGVRMCWEHHSYEAMSGQDVDPGSNCGKTAAFT